MYNMRWILITTVACLTVAFVVSSECRGNSSCSEKVNNGSCGLFETECSYGCCPYSDAVCCDEFATCCPHGSICTKYYWIHTCTKKDKEIAPFSEKTTPAEGRSPNTDVCPTRCYGRCCPLHGAVCCPDEQNCCPANHECTKNGCVIRSSINPPFLQQKVSSGGHSIYDTKKCPADISCPLSTNCCLDGDKWSCCPKPRTNEKMNNGSCGLFKTECSDGFGGKFCCPYSDAVCCNVLTICCRQGQTCVRTWPWGIPRCYGGKFTEDNEIAVLSEKATPGEVRSASSSFCPTRCFGGCCPLDDAVCCPDRENCCPANYECTKDGCVEKSIVNLFLLQKVSSDSQSVFAMKECPGDISCPLSTNCCLDDDKWNCCPKPRTNDSLENEAVHK